MAKVVEFPDQEKMLEQAALWLTLMDERSLEAGEKEDFRQWIQASEQHARAFQEVATLWGRMDILQDLAELFPLEEQSAETETHEVGSSWRRKSMAAAVVVVAVAGSLFSLDRFWLADGSEVYATEVGETEKISLEDNSTVTANTATQLSVSLSKEERRVVLEKGEAYFDVAHDANRPFVVDVGGARVRAVGTAFNVHRRNGSFEVVVTEGLVEVSHQQDARSAVDLEAPDVPSQISDSTLLEVGQMAEYHYAEPGAASITRLTTIDSSALARKLSWRQGMLAFEGDPLEQVIREFSRYTDMDIRIVSDDIRDMRVGGYFSSHDVEGMLKSLRNNFGIEVTRVGDKQVRLSTSSDSSFR